MNQQFYEVEPPPARIESIPIMDAGAVIGTPVPSIYVGKAGEMLTEAQWQEMRSNPEYSQLYVTTLTGMHAIGPLAEIRVHTVWTGEGRPCCAVHKIATPFQTRVFDAHDYLSKLADWVLDLREPWSWETLQDAEAGHRQIVEAIKSRLLDPVVTEMGAERRAVFR